MKNITTKILSFLTASAVFFAAPAANAQKWVMAGVSEASSGLEGGGGKAESTNRAGTRMRLGADLAVDESPEDVFGGAVLLTVEPHTAFGFDGRYTRVVRQKFAFSAGAAAYLQPGSLIGPLGAFEYRHTLAKSFTLTAGPEVDVFVIGTDLPDKTVLWQALFHIGLRVDL